MSEAAVVTLTVDNSGARTGAAEFDAIMARVTRARERQAAKEAELSDRIKKATESGTAGYGPAVERVDRYSRALQQLQAKSDPVFRAELQAQREMAQAYRVVNDAAARGIGTKEQHLRILDAERRRLEEVTRAAQQQGRLPANDNRAIQATTQSYTALRTQAVAATAGLIAFGYAAQRIAGAIATAGDEIRVMAARMNVLTGAAQDSRVAFDQVFAVAQRTGTGLEDVAGSFSRLAISATEFGATTPQIAQVNETLAKLGRIGGATTQEIAAGMQQLGQALASGVLQGDELRSLRENLPLVVRAIAKEFQVSVGQIRQLGEQGDLISARVFRALINASAEADVAFRKLPQTVDQASARSSNAWKLFSAALDDSLGISKLLASSMAATADRVEELARRMAGDIVLAIRDVRAEAARLEAEAAKGKPEQAAPRSPSFFGPGRVISFEEQQAARNAARAADLRRNADEIERWYRGLTDEAGVVEHTDAAARARQKQTADTTKFLRDLQERADPATKALRTFNEEKAKLDAAWKSGIIDQATYNRGLADARKIMSSVGQAAKDTAESIKALADVANEAAFAKRLAASAYEGAAALAKIEADANAAEKALEVFGRRNAAFEQQYSASVLATRNARLEESFRTSTTGIERENELLALQLSLVNERPEIAAREIAALKVRNEIAEKGSAIDQADVQRRIDALTQSELLTRQMQQQQAAAEAAAEPWRNATESMQSYLTDVLTHVPKTWGEAADKIGEIWKRLRAELLTASIIRPIIMQPIVSVLGGLGLVPQSVVSQYGSGLGSIFGGGGGAAGGGGFGDLLGLNRLFGGGSSGGGLFGFLGNQITPASAGSWSTLGAGIYGPPAPTMGALGNLTWGGALAGIGSIGFGALNLAQGNTIGGAAGILGGGLGLLGAAVPALGALGPIGMGIGLIGGLLGGLLKKKPKSPQEVTNILFGDDGSLSSSLAMSRGRAPGTTGPAAGAFGDALNGLLGGYGLSMGPGAMGGWILNSIGKKTGNQYIVGLGSYGSYTPLPGGKTGSSIAGLGSAEEAVNVLTGLVLRQAALSGTLQGATATQSQILRGNEFKTIEAIAQALDFSKLYDQASEGAKVLSQYEQQLESIKNDYATLIQQSKQYGLSTAPLEAQRTARMIGVVQDMNTAAQIRYLGTQGASGVQQANLMQLEENRRREIESALRMQAETGAMANINDIEKYYASERTRINKEAAEAAKAAAKEQADAVTAYWDAVNRNVTQSEQTIRAIRAQYDALIADAQSRGWDAGPLQNASMLAQRQVGLDFNTQARLALLGINDPMAAQKEQLRLSQEARMKEAEAINRLVPGVVDFGQLIKLNNAELKALGDTLIAANDNIRNALDKLNFDAGVSNLTRREQYDLARGEFMDLGRRALAGDTTVDQQRLLAIGDTFTQLSRQLFSIGPNNAADIASARGLYAWLLNPGGARPPGFASGGIAQPGWAMVGEQGPELVRFSTAARVFSNPVTMHMLGGGGDTAALMRQLVDEVRGLRQENADMRRQLATLTAVSAEGVKAQRDTAATNRDMANETRSANTRDKARGAASIRGVL